MFPTHLINNEIFKIIHWLITKYLKKWQYLNKITFYDIEIPMLIMLRWLLWFDSKVRFNLGIYIISNINNNDSTHM